MMLHYFPAYYWKILAVYSLAMVACILFMMSAIPDLSLWLLSAIFFVFCIHPVVLITTVLLLKKKSRLESTKLIWAGLLMTSLVLGLVFFFF
ncbi:hypothetical protein JSY36_05565 [Bacillus sp. H-16]|uniref:hypothetical protein n=1 Tax=Alteribacter salitolerans TaxID=2912333 RepID=UPI0019642A50|nr:hypothetical protein [Alteribacter salitolerans]MBM7095219.1 hypothetical protein [Alteribacter salitolerans]